MQESAGTLKRALSVCALAALAACGAGCRGSSTPLSPEQAASEASIAMRATLERHGAVQEAFPASPPPPSVQTTHPTVTLWHPAHPLMAGLASREVQARLSQAHPGLRMESLTIGEWHQAVQKLTVHLAGGGLPTIAVVRRRLLTQLVGSGRLLAMDTILPASLLEDFLPPVHEAFSVSGRLMALPADAFHSVAFTVGEDQGTPHIGHLPFLEMLWANGGGILEGNRVTLDSPLGMDAFAHFHAVYGMPAGPSADCAFSEAQGLQKLYAGAVTITAASSREAPGVWQRLPHTQVTSIPDGNGVSRWGEYALVVFAEAVEDPEAVAAALDFLTGGDVQGRTALAAGSPPVRRSVLEIADPQHVLNGTFARARATPLVPAWGELEDILMRYLERTRHFEQQAPS